MGLKETDETSSSEEPEDHRVTRDGSLDRRRDFQRISNENRDQPVRDGSLDRRREITAKPVANKPVSDPRDGSLDRTRMASPAKAEPKAAAPVRSGSLDDTRGTPETTLLGSIGGVKGGPGTTRDGSLDSTRTAEPKKTSKKTPRVA